MRKIAVLLALAGVVTSAVAADGVVLKDTRVYSCNDPKGPGGFRKCEPDETPEPMGGEIITRPFAEDSGVCQSVTYSLDFRLFKSDDGQSQVQLPETVEKTLMFKCDSTGKPLV